MYRNCFQRGFFVILHGTGRNPLKQGCWKKIQHSGFIRRVTDEDIRGLVYDLYSGPPSSTYLESSDLGIHMPILNVLIKNVHRSCAIQLIVRVGTGSRRRINAANYRHRVVVSGNSCEMPLALEEGWNHVVFNLRVICLRAFLSDLCQVVTLQVRGSCRLRAIYFTERAHAEDETPKHLRLYEPPPNYAPSKRTRFGFISQLFSNEDTFYPPERTCVREPSNASNSDDDKPNSQGDKITFHKKEADFESDAFYQDIHMLGDISYDSAKKSLIEHTKKIYPPGPNDEVLFMLGPFFPAPPPHSTNAGQEIPYPAEYQHFLDSLKTNISFSVAASIVAPQEPPSGGEKKLPSGGEDEMRLFRQNGLSSSKASGLPSPEPARLTEKNTCMLEHKRPQIRLRSMNQVRNNLEFNSGKRDPFLQSSFPYAKKHAPSKKTSKVLTGIGTPQPNQTWESGCFTDKDVIRNKSPHCVDASIQTARAFSEEDV